MEPEQEKLGHYRSLLPPTDFLGPQDFLRPREVTISRATIETPPERPDEKGKGRKVVPISCLYILRKDGTEHHQKIKIPRSVMHGLSIFLGKNHHKWPGEKLVFCTAECLSFGAREECLRPVFTPAIDAACRAFLNKRKKDPNMYMFEGSGQMGKESAPEPPIDLAAPQDPPSL